jgi:plastocyanin
MFALTRRRVVLGALVPLAFVVALPGVAQGNQHIAMQGNKYAPRDLTVRVGEAVTWMNNDSAGHSVTADDGSFDSHPDCGMLAGRCLQRGESFTHSFMRADRVSYYCRVHGGKGGQGMSGTVTVTD